jgi:hypothetical protein
MQEPRKYAAGLLGIETLNNLEYTLALVLRSFSCLFVPKMVEAVELSFHGREQRMRLMSGVVMNFPVQQFPFKPAVRVEDEAVCVYLVPFSGRFSPLVQLFPRIIGSHAQPFRLEKSERLEIRLTDRESIEFFLDEDPLIAYGRLNIGVAGLMGFVPGPDYLAPGQEGVSA